MTTALYLPEENIGKSQHASKREQLTSVKNRSGASAAAPRAPSRI